MAAAAAAEQVRQLHALQTQLQIRQAQNQHLQAQMLQQQQQQYKQAQSGYTSPPLPSQSSDGSPPLGSVASSYEQRQIAKQQIEANLRARSNGGGSLDQQPGSLIHLQTYPTTHNQPLPSPPVTSTSQTDSFFSLSGHPSKPSLSPTSNGPTKNETASTWRKGPHPVNAVSSGTSSRSSPTPSIRGQPERRSPPLPTGRQPSPDRINPTVASRLDRNPQAGSTARNAQAPSPLPVTLSSRYTPEPRQSGQQTPTFAVVVIRQPRGPPAGADELGGHNFASRIRQKAVLDMSNVLGRRAEMTTGA